MKENWFERGSRRVTQHQNPPKIKLK